MKKDGPIERPLLDENMRDLREYTKKTAKMMGESAIFMALFTDNYTKDVGVLIQFALAIMLDKPIYLNVKKGTHVPKKILQLADGIDYFDDDVEAMESTKRLLTKAIDRKEIKPN